MLDGDREREERKNKMVTQNKPTSVKMLLSMIGGIVPLAGCAIVLAGAGVFFSPISPHTAFAAPGDKASTLEAGDRVPVIVFIQDKDDPSKGKSEGFSCTVMNSGDPAKKVETLLDCNPSKVLENIPAGEENATSTMAKPAPTPSSSPSTGTRTNSTDGSTR